MNATPTPAVLARERTALAWRRTALAFTVNSLLLLRSSDAWLQVAAVFVLAIAAGIAALSARNFRDPDTHGWFARGNRRAEILVLLAASVGLLDLISVLRS
ncbi:MAG: hypothetical protein NVSMB5_09200 [Candidatus Velthaea sp.]